MGGVSFGQEEVTYTVASATSVTASKNIDGVTATFKNTYTGNKEQLTSGNSMTLTLKGYPYTIKQLKLNLHRNSSKGLGTLAMTVGETNVLNKTFVKDDLTANYKEYTFDVATYTATGDVVIKLSATENSLYCNSFTIVPMQDGKTSTTLSFGTDFDNKTITKNVGDIFEVLATLTPAIEGAAITYKSSDATVAEVVDGTVEAKKEGTATITASFAGNDKYKASEASYTITVKKKPGEVEDGVFDFSKPEDYGYEKVTSDGITMPAGAEVKAGNVTLKVLKKGTTDASWWNDGVWRIYKNSEHELSVSDGYVITSVTIVSTSKSYAKYKIQGGTLGKNWSGASQKVSIVNDPSGNSRIKTITVKYAKCESLTTAASGFSTYAADYAVNYTEAGLKAYAVKVSDDNTKVAYTEYTGVVPAGKAVLVKGEANNEYTLTPAAEDADATFDTDLQISDGTVTADGTTIFAFGTKNNVSGFKIVKNGVVIPEKKGYLVVANASAAKDFFAFDDSTNGIDDPTIEIGEEEVPLFNLAGQRVGKDYKGIVVKNGKKYVNK